MILFKHSGDLESYLGKLRSAGLQIGFAPTMGALHPGHISLIERSKRETDVTVCSVYVNPVQFNNKDDFKAYPVNLEADILLLEQNGCDILFHPDEKDIYPDEESKNKHFAIGRLANIFEGKFRPGHFQGVCLVVEKLLDIVNPTHLFLGQKDYQQTLVIKKLVSLLHKNIRIIVCPTLRGESGLAMSSRNLRLSASGKELASELHKSLVYINDKIFFSDIVGLKKEVIANLESKGFKVDYLETATTGELEPVQSVEPKSSYIIVVAAYLGDVRLIDNLIITS